MTSLTLDQAIPVAQNLAKRKAGAFARRSRLPFDECEDVQSHLILTFISRWPKFDSRLAGVRTFASRVMDHEIASLLRYKLAARRKSVASSVSGQADVDFDEKSLVVLTGPLEIQPCRTHFWRDVDHALSPFPKTLHETAYALGQYTPTELARVLGRSRTAVYHRIRLLREAFVAAGIGPDYFTRSGEIK